MWALFLILATAYAVRTTPGMAGRPLPSARTLLVVLAERRSSSDADPASNLDVAFQGVNTWHSFQYLAVVLYLNRFRVEKGLIGLKVVERRSPATDQPCTLCASGSRSPPE